MKRRYLFVLAAVAIFAAIIVMNRYVMEQRANQPAVAVVETVQKLTVSTLTVKSDSYQSLIIGYGAVQPHFSLTLTAQVSGQIDGFNPRFEVGEQISTGSILVQLEDSDYRAAVASAESDVAAARLSLLEEQREGEQARREWIASGLPGEPDSPLVLREPQRRAAEAVVTQAETTLDSAQTNLDNTRIKAPFDAIIVSRSVSPGSYVQSGDEIATLYSADRMEISVALSAEQWSTLPDPATMIAGSWPVTLEHVENHTHWTGYVIRCQQHVNDTTRQRSLTIAVDQPLSQTPALLAGTFVKATIVGRTMDNLWQLPSSALSQRGEIWYVTDQHTLESFTTEPVFSRDRDIYIAPPPALAQAPQQVLTHPLSSYTRGMEVKIDPPPGNVHDGRKRP